jgi:hypothetical protein
MRLTEDLRSRRIHGVSHLLNQPQTLTTEPPQACLSISGKPCQDFPSFSTFQAKIERQIREVQWLKVMRLREDLRSRKIHGVSQLLNPYTL